MDLMEQYLERPKAPGNLREAVGLVHALWDLFNGCRHLVLELRDTITQLEGIIDSLKATSLRHDFGQNAENCRPSAGAAV